LGLRVLVEVLVHRCQCDFSDLCFVQPRDAFWVEQHFNHAFEVSDVALEIVYLGTPIIALLFEAFQYSLQLSNCLFVLFQLGLILLDVGSAFLLIKFILEFSPGGEL
jgi:hypothetical protein